MSLAARQVIIGWAAHPRHHRNSEAGTAGVQNKLNNISNFSTSVVASQFFQGAYQRPFHRHSSRFPSVLSAAEGEVCEPVALAAEESRFQQMCFQ